MSEAREARGTAAWAAAALVFALGGLGFGVAAHFRITDLQERLDRAESRSLGATTTPTGAATSTVPGASSGTGTRDGSSASSTTGSTTSTSEEPSAPPDVEAAKALVTTAFTTVYQGSAANETRLALIDDPTGVDAALTAAATGANGPLVAASTAVVNDITFTSATRAKVAYTVTVPGQPTGTPRVGDARQAGGTWKVTRSTVCDDLAAVGAPCA